MTDKRTPGPWIAQKFTRPHGGPDGVRLFGFRVFAPGALDGRDLQICEAYPAPHPVAVNEANAALIAEAPAMVEALADLVGGATGAAVIARNEANARGDYAAPYVSQLTAAIEAGRAILARIDGAPSGEAVSDDPAVRAAANLSRAGLIDAAREAEELAAPISEAVGATGGPAAPALQTFTAFCQQSDGRGTIWISQVEAPDAEAAQQVARDECAADWGYQVECVHCLGIAVGAVEIAQWEDLND